MKASTTMDGTQTTTAVDAPGPVRVATIDVARPLTDLDCTRGADERYEQAWILALHDGRPLGMVQVPVDAPTIPAAELGALLRTHLGSAWAAAARGGDDGTHAAAPARPLPRATVVVPTTASRAEQLVECVRRLSALDYPDFEVIVIDNRGAPGAGDEALERVAGLPGVRVLAERRPGISAARNAGLQAATGEIVAYTDDDVEVDPRWLLALGRRFADDPAADAVTGLVMPKELETPAQVWFERSGSGLDRTYVALSFESAARGHGRSGAFSPHRFRVVRRAAGETIATVASLYATGEFGLGSNMAFRIEALRALGGFDEALGAGTETHGGEDLAMLLELLVSGRRLVHDPAAIVHHIHRREVAELERQIRGYGIGLTATLAALVWRDPRHIAGLLAVVPAALRSMASPSTGKRAKQPAGYPGHLVRMELRGMLSGPLAYARSRRHQRRWTERAG
jgi:GT2 family glycosyltransferase